MNKIEFILRYLPEEYKSIFLSILEASIDKDQLQTWYSTAVIHSDQQLLADVENSIKEFNI